MKYLLPFLILSVKIVLAQGSLAYVSNDNYAIDDTWLEAKKEAKTVFTPEILNSRLKQLNEQTPLNVIHNATTERYIRVFLRDRKENFSNLLSKGEYYFPIFEEQLAKHNLPIELKYLAVVESALDPNAESRVGAKGLWQFMYHTGKQYKLNVDSYVDERLDPRKASEAACNYLKSLHKTFGDWNLALAAYNAGPGNVRKALKKARGQKNYWNIRQYLPEETKGYVPAFYANMYLFEYANKHQIHPNKEIITLYDVDTIHIKEKLQFTDIKNRFDIKDNLIERLNPQYKLGVIPKNITKKYYLTLPKFMIDEFKFNESELYQLAQKNKVNEKLSFILPNKSNSYVVNKQDNLKKIAKKFGITIAQLKKWNGLQTNFLIEGQWLVVTNKTE